LGGAGSDGDVFYQKTEEGGNRMSVEKRLSQHWNEIDPSGKEAHEPGAKLDAGKLHAWLMLEGFSLALAEVAKVTTAGAQKYSPNGWQTVPCGTQRYMDAFARHMFRVGAGESVDADTGCLHKAQMIWNLLASLELELRPRGLIK
jgi:hypothetical protein